MAPVHRRRSRSFDLLSSYSHYTPGWTGLIGFLAMCLAGTLIGIGVGTGILIMERKGILPEGFYATYGLLITYPLMFIPAMIFASAKSRRNELFETGYAIDSNNFKPIGGLKAALACIFGIIAAGIVLDPLNLILPEMDEKTKAALELALNGPFWVNFLSVSIFAPIFEEWLCRGMILRSLLRKCHPALAICISAAFFGIIHGNIWQAIPAFLIGLLFGWVYYRTGSLKLTMLMHFVNNTLSLCISRVPSLKDCDNYLEMVGGNVWQYAAIIAAGVVIFAAAVVLFNKIKPVAKDGSCDIIEAENLVG